MWNPLKNWWKPPSDEDFQRRRQEILKEVPIPEIWMFGKTGSGKSSIIRYLTGAKQAEIGNGFRPQTMTASLYSFPDEETPLMRFWDTRGLGEADYDEQSDLELLESKVQLIIVVVRAMDHATDQIVQPLRRIRKSNPNRPVLLALTALHDAYPGKQHPEVNPFESIDGVASDSGTIALPDGLDDTLQRSLNSQLQRFDGLYDRFVAIDLTPEDEGFDQPNFGGQLLSDALLDLMPLAYQQTILQLDEMRTALGNLHREKVAPIILAHSAMAASAAAMPIPWVDIPAILTIQSNMARKLAKLNQQELDSKTWASVGGAIGGGQALVQMGIREGLKIIPYVGMALNSASAFAMTYATGWVWNWYFMERKWGHVPTTEELKRQYSDQLKKGASLWATTKKEADAPE